MLVSILDHQSPTRKRKSADVPEENEVDVKRARGEEHDSATCVACAAKQLYHVLSGHHGAACHLTLIANADVQEPYEWICEVCEKTFAADHPGARRRCDEHAVDVCTECYASRVASNELEVTQLNLEEEELAEDVSDGDESHASEGEQDVESDAGIASFARDTFFEDEAEEASSDETSEADEAGSEDSDASDTDSEHEVDAEESDCADSADEEPDDDVSEQRGHEVALYIAAEQSEKQAAVDVKRLLLQSFPDTIEAGGAIVVPPEVCAQLEHLWTAHPRSLNEVLRVCTTEQLGDGYGRVPFETDGALFACFIGQLSAMHVPALLRAVKRLLPRRHEHGEMFHALLNRARDLSPESHEALQSDQFLTVKPRERRYVRDAVVRALADVQVPVEQFCAGALLQYRRLSLSLDFTSRDVADELLEPVGQSTGEAATLALDKLSCIWAAYPLTGVSVALHAIRRWSSLQHEGEWRKYGPALLRLIEQHVAVAHLGELVDVCRGVLQGDVVYSLLVPLYARLTALAPPEVVAQFACMPTLAQTNVAAIDADADEADARELAAESEADEPDAEDEAFIAAEDPEEDDVAVSSTEGSTHEDDRDTVVHMFAREHIERTGDRSSRVTATAIYRQFVEWHHAHFSTAVPSRKAFGNQFQLLFPDKVRQSRVFYLGIVLL